MPKLTKETIEQITAGIIRPLRPGQAELLSDALLKAQDGKFDPEVEVITAKQNKAAELQARAAAILAEVDGELSAKPELSAKIKK